MSPLKLSLLAAAVAFLWVRFSRPTELRKVLVNPLVIRLPEPGVKPLVVLPYTL